MIKGGLWRGVLAAAFISTSLQAGTSVIVGSPPLAGTGNCDPFGCAAFFGLGTYQQVYISTAFTGPLTFAQLTFYDTQVLKGGKADQGTYTLSFSYTSKAPGMLDLENPANNIGSNSQTFFTGPLPTPTSGPGGTQTLTFAGAAYPYDPANGNLLLTVTVSSPVDAVPTPLDLDQSACGYPPNGCTLQTTNAYFGIVKGQPVSGGNDVGGLVTGFAATSLQITAPTSLAPGSVGVPYGPVTFTATGGAGGYTWAATGLPSGLSFSTAGVLSGTPSTGSQGSYNPQFTVTDSSSNQASVNLALLINQGNLQITGPTSLSPGTVGVMYGPVTFTVMGGSGGGYTWSATGLPGGLGFSVGGILVGTPSAGSQGSYNPQFTVTDSSNNKTSVTLPLVINPALQITGPTSLPSGTVGVSYGPVTFTATGGSGGYTWSATGLPSGLSISAGGMLSGTPATGSQGSYNPQFTVTDSSSDKTSVTLSLLINASSLQITGPASLPSGTVGVSYGPVTFTATGGSGGYTWSATGLPSGLSISSGGVLGGTPATGSQGSYNPQFTVTDSSSNKTSVTLPLVINPASLQITGPASLPSGTVGVSYGPVTFTATGGSGGYTWSATGLPSGLSISSGGVLGGTPATGSQGSYNPQFTVTDSSSNKSSVTLPLIINSANLQITGPAALPSGTVGVSYGSVTFTATGGTGVYTWSATGLPNGLSFSAGGVLSGTPATGSQGSYNPQFTVTDSSNNKASVNLALVINSASLQITGPAALPSGTVGVSYGSVTFTATGGTGVYTWSATGLPNGLSFSAGGVLSGTPATGSQGSYNPQFTVTDSSNNKASVNLALVINSANLQITGPASLPSGMVGLSYGSVTFTATGGTGVYTWSATGLPNGLSFSAGGVLSGTPATGSQGSYNPQFTVTDSSNNKASVNLALVINSANLQIIGPASLPSGMVGLSYGPVTFTATGGTGVYTWSATGLPSGLGISPGGVLSGVPATGSQGSYNPQFTVTDSSSNSGSVTLALVINPGALLFIPVTPCRVVDTRNPPGPFGGPGLDANSRDFNIPTGACGIPGSAVAYSLNVTAVPSGPLGYLTIWPTGQPQPVASTLNSENGIIKADAAIVPAGQNGSVSVYASGATNVVLDINGYFVSGNSAGLAFYPISPCRVVDTRNAPGTLGGPIMTANQTRTFPLPSGGCGIPSTAQAYSLNFTVVPSGPLGYLTTWPAGGTQPVVSTLNAPTGLVTANAAIVPAGGNDGNGNSGGAIDVFTSATTQVVIDINGYFAPPSAGGLSFYTLTPCRVVDTRNADGPLGGPELVAGQQRSFPLAGSCGLPLTAQAFSLNATVVPTGSLGYLTLWATGDPQPVVSTLNSPDGSIDSNAAIVPTLNGSISAYASDGTQLILDTNGYFAP